METKAFQTAVNRWCKALSEQIAVFRKAGKKVYIIALSRKMPRFFDWLAKAVPSPEAEELILICTSEDVEITTEYAIPLIYANHCDNPDAVAGIIADDVIIFGATANRVALQWKAFFGQAPTLYALFRSNANYFAVFNENDYSSNMQRYSLRQLEPYVRLISSRIMSTSLPIDMEYPIIHINRPYEEVKQHIINSIPGSWPRYEVKSDMIENASESFSVVLDNAKAEGYTNDFVKFRLFSKETECCLEIIETNGISTFDLDDEDLFANKAGNKYGVYSDAWQRVFKLTDKASFIPSKASQNALENSYALQSILASKLLWAEYLYALSAFVRNYDLFVPEATNCALQQSDMSLILGKETTSEVFPDACEILASKTVFNVSFLPVAFPDYVNPKELRDVYMRKVSETLKPGLEIEKNLDNLFNISHFASDIFSSIGKHDTLGHHCFGESYESLAHRLSLYHKTDAENRQRINHWVDLRVDESRVAPKYEIVTGSDNMQYYKRFFLSGSNKQPV